MEITHKQIPFSQASNFPKLFIDYIARNPQLSGFYDSFPDLDGFKETIAKRKFNHRKDVEYFKIFEVLR